MRVVEGNAKRASVAWSSVSTSPSSAWSGGVSTCGKAREEKDGGEEGDGREARGHMSSSPGGGVTVVVGGTGWSVQDQLVENSVCDDGGGTWASHSDSACRDIASLRCLRMRAAARADEGKAAVLGEEEDEEESEEKELEDIVWGGSW